MEVILTVSILNSIHSHFNLSATTHSASKFRDIFTLDNEGDVARVTPPVISRGDVNLVDPKVNAFASKYLTFGHQSSVTFNVNISSPQADVAKGVLQRLPVEQQASLKNSKLLLDPSFIELASNISDKELSQLVTVHNTLTSSPSTRHQHSASVSGDTSIDKFIYTLTNVDDKSRSKMLEIASDFSSRVSVPKAVNTYSSSGLASKANDSSANNDFHNFITAVNKTDDIDAIFSHLAKFDQTLQSSLLNVLSVSPELGAELVSSLSSFEESTQEMVLSFMGKAAKEIKTVSGHNSLDIVGNNKYLTFDDMNDLGSNQVGIIEDTVSLLANYQFDDEQVSAMVTELTSMKNEDQQAYLKISTQGLQHIIGKPESGKINLDDQQQAIETVELLRSDKIVRKLVLLTGMGDVATLDTQDKDKFYTIKAPMAADSAQKSVIEMLTTDAWIRSQNGDSHYFEKENNRANKSSALAQGLIKENAEQRDKVVKSINSMASNTKALSKLSTQQLNLTFSDVYARTSTLVHLPRASQMLEITGNIDDDLMNDYWQSYSLAGDKVDQLSQALRVEPSMQESLIKHFSSGVRTALNEGNSLASMKKELTSYIELMNSDKAPATKQAYIKELLGNS